jgi:hypothetical protein
MSEPRLFRRFPTLRAQERFVELEPFELRHHQADGRFGHAEIIFRRWAVAANDTQVGRRLDVDGFDTDARLHHRLEVGTGV